MPGPSPDTTMRTGTGEVIPGKNHISTDTIAQVMMIHIEAIPGYDIGIIATTPGVAHDAQVSDTGVIAINPTMKHHINPTAYHPHTEAHHHTTPYQSCACSHPSYKSSDHPHTEAHHHTTPYQSCACSHPSYKSSRQDSHRSHLQSSRSQSKPHHKKNTKVKIEDPNMNYFSSDDHSSDSGEETDHLN